MTTETTSVYPALEDRPIKDTICLFDVDGTLTPARRVGSSQPALPSTVRARSPTFIPSEKAGQLTPWFYRYAVYITQNAGAALAAAL